MSDTNKLREKTMKYDIVDGVLWAVMFNSGAWFLTPFAIAINAHIMVIGALNSIPALLDGIAQKASVRLSELGWKRKSIFFWGVAAQTFGWLGLAAVAWLAWLNLWPGLEDLGLVFFATWIYMFGGLANPPWFALMGDVVPEKQRGTWFGMRSRVTNFAGFAALLIAGFFMQQVEGEAILGFIVLFLLAFTARLTSVYVISRHWDPKPEGIKKVEVKEDFDRYEHLLPIVWFSILLAGPYTPVLMLGVLGFNYGEYTVYLAVQALMYMMSYPHWGRLIDTHGAKSILVATVALNGLYIVLWGLVSTPLEAAIIAIPGGLLWAGTISSAFNYVYQAVEPKARIKAMGDSSFFSGIGSFAGTITGGAIISVLGDYSRASFQILFLISAVFRLVAAILIYKFAKEVSAAGNGVKIMPMMFKIMTVYPVRGLAHDLHSLVHFGEERIKKRFKPRNF
ncbi:MFS transporter [Candidatus Micrarchaeota archaeon]|nr:MFS transporter [Candidatus Micrarchaeota archaeon]